MTIRPDEHPTRPAWRLLACILLLGAALRLYQVHQPLTDTFSWRQASTAMMADNFYRTSANIFYPEVSWTGPGPNYQGREFQTLSYLASILFRVFGQHESIGRGLSIAFGLLGIFSMYMLVRRVWDELRARAAALMLAILPGAIFIDRSFLPDPAMLGLTLCATWLVVRALQTGGTPARLVAAGAVTALAFLTKLPGTVALPAMVYVAVRTTAHARRLGRPGPTPARLLAVLALVLVPIVAYYAWAVHLGRSYPPYHIAGSSNWVWKDGLRVWIGRLYYLDSTLSNLTYWLWTVPVFGLVLLGLVVPPPRTRGVDADAEATADVRWAFHYWIGGCVVLYALGARELSENVWNFHVFNAFAAAFAGHALVLITTLPSAAGAPSPRVVRVRVAAVVVMTLLFAAWYLTPFFNPRRSMSGYRMGKALNAISQPGDLVVTMGDDVGDPIPIYYSHRRGWVFPPAHLPKIWKPWNMIPPDPQKSIAMFEDLRGRGPKWLGIVTKPRDDTPGSRNFWVDHPKVVAHIDATCEFVEKTNDYVIYRIKTPAELAAGPTTAATRPVP